MEYQEIFDEYYTMFRNQGSTLPSYGDREYTLAVRYANSAIRKWDRVDGTLWRELVTTAQEQTTGVWATLSRTVSSSTVTMPNNIRKTPPFVQFTDPSTGRTTEVWVEEPYEVLENIDTSAAWFSGGANTGYTLHLGEQLATEVNGWTVDFVYIKKPTTIPTDSDPSAIVVEMSDPNFMILDMLVSRHRGAKSGFGYKTTISERDTALLNMKIENSSGVWGNPDRMRDLLKHGQGWGVNKPIGDIKL